MQEILRIPIETVYDTVLENLLETGVITGEEKEHYKMVLEAMSGEELIDTLIESHILRENLKKFYSFPLAERNN